MKDEELKRLMVDIIASTKVAGIGYYQRVVDRLWREAIDPYVNEIKAGYEEKMFAHRRGPNDKNH